MIQKKQISITGMNCNHCVRTIESELSQLKGIKSIKVDLINAKANLEYESKIISLEKIIFAIKSLGYNIKK